VSYILLVKNNKGGLDNLVKG